MFCIFTLNRVDGARLNEAASSLGHGLDSLLFDLGILVFPKGEIANALNYTKACMFYKSLT